MPSSSSSSPSGGGLDFHGFAPLSLTPGFTLTPSSASDGPAYAALPGMRLYPSTSSRPWAVLLLASPPVNALTAEMYDALRQLLAELERSEDTDTPTLGLIIGSALHPDPEPAGASGESAKAKAKAKKPIFTAGNALTSFFPPTTTESAFHTYWSSFQSALLALYSTPLVTLTASAGYAGAAGTGLLLASDWALLSSHAAHATRAGLGEVALGVPVPRAWCAMLAQRASSGQRAAERLAKHARMLSAEEALRHGLADELAGPGAGCADAAAYDGSGRALLALAETRMAALLSACPPPGEAANASVRAARRATKGAFRGALAREWAADIERGEEAGMFWRMFNAEGSRELVGGVLGLDKDGRRVERKGRL